MAANHSGPRGGRLNSPVPFVAPFLGGAGMAVVTFGAVILLWIILGSDAPPPPVPPVLPGPDIPSIAATTPKVEAWWDTLPDKRLAGMAILLKQTLPQDQALFDSLGDTTESVRLASYQKLTTRLPELIRNPQAKDKLGRFLIDCYALEPAEKNVTPLRDWLVRQIPKEDAEYPANFKVEDLERSFWAFDVSLDTLTGKPIQPDRLKPLAHDLGKAFGFTIDPDLPEADLRPQAEIVFAQRCYSNLAPTSVKSLDGALALREALVRKFPHYLTPNFRENIDLDIAFGGLPAARKSWPAYRALLQDCLDRKNAATDPDMIELYAQADPETADMIEPLLAVKWKVLKDRTLTREAKVKNVKKVIGDPTDRLTRFEKLANEALVRAKAPSNKSRALLQETARLAYVSTLGCALLQKEKGLARFDEWITKVPQVDQGQKNTPSVKGAKPKQPAGPPGVAIGPTPRPFSGKIDKDCQADPNRAGAHFKFHLVALKGGKTYEVHMQMPGFDNSLRVENSNKDVLMEDNNGGMNAFARFTAHEDDDRCRIIVSSTGVGIRQYVVTAQEFVGFGGPGFGPPGFPRPLQFGNPFKFRPPPLMPVFPPPQPPVVVIEKPAPAASTTTQISQDDLADLKKSLAKTRVTAFHNIVDTLPKVLAQNDVAAPHAQAIANYLLTIKTKAELDQVLAEELQPAAGSRNLLLALADKVDQKDAEQIASEAIVGALIGQLIRSGKDDNWSLRCRKLLLLEALEIADKQTNAATQTAAIIRNQYEEQGILLGMDAAGLKKLTQPAQVMESVIKHLAEKAGKQDPTAKQKECLDQVQRDLLVAEFVAQTDLEHTVMLQRVWLKVLSIHLEQHTPQRAEEMHKLQQEWSKGNRTSLGILDQLRSGEEKVLRMWVLAHDPK